MVLIASNQKLEAEKAWEQSYSFQTWLLQVNLEEGESRQESVHNTKSGW